MNFFYNRIEHNQLLKNLNNKEIASSLAYMIDFAEHENLVIEPKENCILIHNQNITIAIILYVGFENLEYNFLQNNKNFHSVSFDTVTQSMCEFEHLHIKFIDKNALVSMVLARSKNELLRKLYFLKNN